MFQAQNATFFWIDIGESALCACYDRLSLLFVATVVFHELSAFERIDISSGAGVHFPFELCNGFIAILIHP